MTAEGTPRAPHTRTYTLDEHGATRTCWLEVDHRGTVQISEELLDQLLRRAGFTETTAASA